VSVTDGQTELLYL